mgnify:CR=1 FL=1
MWSNPYHWWPMNCLLSGKLWSLVKNLDFDSSRSDTCQSLFSALLSHLFNILKEPNLQADQHHFQQHGFVCIHTYLCSILLNTWDLVSNIPSGTSAKLHRCWYHCPWQTPPKTFCYLKKINKNGIYVFNTIKTSFVCVRMNEIRQKITEASA